MSGKKIQRRVVKVDTDNQQDLFADSHKPSIPKDKSPIANRTVTFNRPDPKQIFLNQTRLDKHLRNAGQIAPLKVRVLLEQLDWTSFESSYKPGGRSPYAPGSMLGIILLGVMQGISSLRNLEDFSRTNLGCLWVGGGIQPDHSVIGRFINRHEQLLTGDFFEQLTRQILKETGTDTRVVAGDGTVIEAAASRFKLVREEALKAQIKQAQDSIRETPDPGKAQHLKQLEDAHERLRTRQAARAARGKKGELQINPREPDAVIQPQKNKKVFAASYKPSVLANDKRVIVGIAVDPSSETCVVGPMFDQAQTLGCVDTALFDAGYFCEGVLTENTQRGIELLCPEGQSRGKDWKKQSTKQYLKNQFEYNAEQDVYRCPQNQILKPLSRYQGNKHYKAYTLYGTSACLNCSHKNACTSSAKGRRIKRYACDDAKDKQRRKMEQDDARERYSKRQAMVEPVFSQMRDGQGLNRFRRKGLKAVRLEFALHAMAYNLNRVKALCQLKINPFWLVLDLQEAINRYFHTIAIRKDNISKNVNYDKQIFTGSRSSFF